MQHKITITTRPGSTPSYPRAPYTGNIACSCGYGEPVGADDKADALRMCERLSQQHRLGLATAHKWSARGLGIVR